MPDRLADNEDMSVVLADSAQYAKQAHYRCRQYDGTGISCILYRH